MKLTRFFIVLVLLLFLQIRLQGLITIDGISPDLLIVGVIYFALFGSPRDCLIACVSLGLLKDIFSFTRFGLSLAIFIIVGAILNRLRYTVSREYFITHIFLAFLSTFFCYLVFSVPLSLNSGHLGLSPLIYKSLLVAFYTMLISPFLIKFLMHLRSWFNLGRERKPMRFI